MCACACMYVCDIRVFTKLITRQQTDFDKTPYKHCTVIFFGAKVTHYMCRFVDVFLKPTDAPSSERRKRKFTHKKVVVHLSFVRVSHGLPQNIFFNDPCFSMVF